MIFSAGFLQAQQANNAVKKGNDAYKKGDYKTAQENYADALHIEPGNEAARFNMGNALQKQNSTADAEKEYDEIISKTNDASLKGKAYYNKGLSLIARQQLIEAIDAFKQSLMLSPADNDTRENLQKALNELQQQQKQNQPQQKNNQPQQNKSKLTQQKAEQYLQQLREEEKRLQKELQKKPDDEQTDMDW